MFFRNSIGAFKANLHRNINPRTWYRSSHNGVTLVVHAWYALAAMQNQHESHTNGVRLNAWDIYRSCQEKSLIFTNRTELRKLTDGWRHIGHVVGNDRELELFQQHFVLEPHALLVPNRETMRGIISSPCGLGSLEDPDAFSGVVKYANNICANAERDFR